MNLNYTEPDEKYRKPSQRTTPPKADHRHEYVKGVCMMYARLGNAVSAKKYRFTTQPFCIECGHQGKWSAKAVEVSVSPREYRLYTKKKEN